MNLLGRALAVAVGIGMSWVCGRGLVARGADAAAPAGAGRIKVFVLAGQSNMEGQAVADLDGPDYNDGRGTLVALLRDPVKGPDDKGP